MLSWFLSTSVLITVILALRRLLRDKIDPRLTYALWLLVALRILIPVSLFSHPVSVASFTEQSGISESAEQVREVLSPKSVMTTSIPADSHMTMEEIAESWSDSGLQVYEVRPYTEEELAEIRRKTPGFYQNTDSLPLRMTVEKLVGRLPFWNWVYLAGCFVTLVVLNRVDRNFHKRVKKYRKPYEGVLPVDCPIPVYVMSSLPSPCLYLMNRPAIYLNDAAVKSDHLDHILTHEIVHFRHRDHWWAVVRCVCLIVQWFNPLVWLAAYLSRQDCELACDASVIKQLGEEQRLSYGKTLVDMIAAARTPSTLLQTATTMTDGKKGIAQRIQLIVKRPKMTAATLVAVLLIATVTAACAFGGAEDRSEPNDPPNLSDSSTLPSEEPEPPVAVSPALPSGEAEPSASLPADLSAADLAQSVYAAIVGEGANRDFSVEVSEEEDSHDVATLHITPANSPNVDYVGRCLPSFVWDYAADEGSCAGNAFTLTSSDGETWLRCWEGTDRVRLHVDGQDFFLTATRPKADGEDMELYHRLLLIAEDALWDRIFSVTVPDGLPDDGRLSELVVIDLYTQKVALNLMAVPDWVSWKPLDVQVGEPTWEESYFYGDLPNFTGSMTLYVKLDDPYNATWQAGSGLTDVTDGTYAGYGAWTMGVSFRFDWSAAEYQCIGLWTGGGQLTFPTPLNEATADQLFLYALFTSAGHANGYLIPYQMFTRFSAEEINRAMLDYTEEHGTSWQARQVAQSIGQFLALYGGEEGIPTYEEVRKDLDSTLHAKLDEGYSSIPK